MSHLNYKYHEYIDEYMNQIRSGEILAGEEIHLAMDLVERKLSDKDVFIDSDKIYEAVRVMEENFDIELLNWQRFETACIHCYYKSDDSVVFDTFFNLLGRGNGKNGYISPLAWYLTTHVHGVRGYDVDIIANSEDQAKNSFEDIYDMLDNNWNKMKKGFTKTKSLITSKSTNSKIKYNTSNARTKDGKRSACLIFDEIHEYEDSKIINVFLGGFGKKKHSRTFYITTNGYVRGGVLDKELKKMNDILNNVNGMGDRLKVLPLIYKLKNEEEAEDPKNWVKANPSLPYFPLLKQEMEKHWIDRDYDHERKLDFYTKRMNLPKEDTNAVVTNWKNIEATNRPIPYDKLKGKQCIGSIDYAQTTDFCSVGLLFKMDGNRYWIEHTFVNKSALSIPSREIKFPVMEMVDKGLITIINEPTIRAEVVADWFSDMINKYHIKNIVADDYRADYLEMEFRKRGLPFERIRSGPITHGKVAPVISSIFAERTLIWGDNPTMNWYTWNTYTEMDKKGNITYLKIEPKTRKTDGFFAFIHAMSKDKELIDVSSSSKRNGIRMRVRSY